MPDYAALEISLHRLGEGEYTVDFRFDQPGSAADVRSGQGQPARIKLNLAELRAQVLNPLCYAQTLSACFFADEQVKDLFNRASSSAETLGVPLRVRLIIGPGAPELHAVYWESLLDPENGAPLFTGEKIFFSRYLSSLDLRPVRLSPKAELNSLVFIANPSDLSRYRLAEIAVEDEYRRAVEGLGGIPARRNTGGPATLDSLVEALRSQKPDILYLVCHGELLNDEPYLWFEKPDGSTDVLPGKDLVTRIRELSHPPLLMVLASCKSGGHANAGDARGAVGPRLAEAGIPAVVAMQGDVSMPTLAEFMPVFFNELQQDGQVDRAMSLGRGAVRDCGDYWMPVLYTRLKTGCIFGEEPQAQPISIPRRKLTWRLWAALAAVATLLLAALGWAFYTTPWIPPMGAGYNIVVAPFTEVDSAGHERVTKDSRQVSEWLYEDIQREEGSFSQIISFDLRGPDKVRPVQGADREQAAGRLAVRHNASLLIYGTLRHGPQGYEVIPEFFIADRAVNALNYTGEITGANRLGKAISLGPAIGPQAYASNQQLKVRARVLRTLVTGLAYLAAANYPAAEVQFGIATADREWADEDGKEVGYLLLGTARLMEYDPVNHTGVLPGAQEAFEKANQLNSDYPRPYLGLADVTLLGVTMDQADKERRFKRASELYAQAKTMVGSSPVLQIKARYGEARLNLFGYASKMPGWTFDNAVANFKAVIAYYDQDPTPQLTWNAANSHAYLGWLAGDHQQWPEMSRQCRQATDLLAAMPGKLALRWSASYWECAAFAEEKAENIPTAINYYTKALSVGQNGDLPQPDMDRIQSALDQLKRGTDTPSLKEETGTP